MGNTNEATENVNVNEEYTTKKLRRVLGKKELISMGLGQIIGSGVFSLTGVAIGFTGRSVVFAFLFGAVLSGGYHPQHFCRKRGTLKRRTVHDGKPLAWRTVFRFLHNHLYRR